MEKPRIIPVGIVWPFILLSSLFFAWAIPNNLTDTMLAAFKRIMSLTDTKTAWIQVACYFFGYGCFAVPGALYIKKYTYKSGVILGLAMFAMGTFMFYPAMITSRGSTELGFVMYLLALLILFAGLSILETSTNSYVYEIGPESTATQRLNFAQSFNPFGAIFGVIISQVFVLSRLNTMTASQRAVVPRVELIRIQGLELKALSLTYVIIGMVMVGLLLTIYFTRMPILKENDKRLDFAGTFRRLRKNRNYMWALIAQFFYVGAQIAVWSFIIRYVMQQMHLDEVIASIGLNPTTTDIIVKLRNLEPVASVFYNFLEWIGLNALLPRTAEQAGATYYIMSLCLFVIGRFVCTALMKFIKPRHMLSGLALLAFILCMVTIYGRGHAGIYALMGISGCMSLMFPTIYGLGIDGLKDDTKIGGAGMIMAIAGAAFLTQVQGIVSDESGDIIFAYWVPAIAFGIVGFYAAVVARKHEMVKLQLGKLSE